MSTTDISRKIKAALLIKGITAAQIARTSRVTRQAVANTLNGLNKSPRLRLAIAHAINVDVRALWPDFKDRGRGGKQRKQSRAKAAANADLTPGGRDECT